MAARGAQLTMQQIADLARVQRPVVSTWRRRCAGSESPFPAPVGESALVFDAEEVGRWLEVTGRGNNPEARADAVLYSTLLDSVAASVADASALFLLHAQSGAPLTDSDPGDLLQLLEEAQVGAILSTHDAKRALADAALVEQVDALVEAGVTAPRVMARLVAKHEMIGSRLGAEALTGQGDALVTSVLETVLEDADRALVPWGEGGLRLLVSLAERLPEARMPSVVAPAEVNDDVDLLLWRYAVALGVQLVPAPTVEDVLVVGQWVSADLDNASGFFDELDEVVLDLAMGSAALVVAPAPLLVDRMADPEPRRRVLGAGGYLAPLRYVARLPAGLCRYGGRRRLALWALGHAIESGGDRLFTTYCEHSAHSLEAAECRAVGNDVVAALRGSRTRRAHAFLRGAHRATEVLAARESLAVPLSEEVVEDGGDALARLWELRDASAPELLDGIEVEAAGAAADRSVPWSAATTGTDRLARVLKGLRIPQSVWDAGPGGIEVIGPEEVRGSAPVGARSVDLVALVEGAPRFALTEPGDVVFVTTTTRPAAMIDSVGGNIAQAPARILRCLEPANNRRRILPETAVHDIRDSRGSDARAWRLRTVDGEACVPWRRVVSRAAEHRQRLLRELAALDAVTTELSNGLAAGTLRVTQLERDESKENN